MGLDLEGDRVAEGAVESEAKERRGEAEMGNETVDCIGQVYIEPKYNRDGL